MRIRDYVKLAGAGLWRQKLQTLKIILIMGSIFVFVMTVGFLVWGAENLGIEKINQPTGRRVLVYAEINTDRCREGCENEIELLKDDLRKYGGEIIEQTGVIETGDGELDVLPEYIVRQAVEVDLSDNSEEAIPVLIPTKMAMMWTGIADEGAPTFDADKGMFDYSSEITVDAIRLVREQVLGKTIVSPNGEKYFVVGFLPSNVRTNFVMDSGSDFLNIFIGRTTVGNSRKLLVVDDETIQSKGHRIWVVFDTADLAYNYYIDQEAKCYEFGSGQSYDVCGYTMVSPFGFELDPKWSYGSTEKTFKYVVAIFGTLAVIVNIITLVRIVKSSNKIAVLYHMTGARSSQIRIIQGLRMVILCVLTSVFVLLVSVLGCLIINAVYTSTLMEVYALSFGTPLEFVMLLGCKWEILLLIGMIFLATPFAMLFSWRRVGRGRWFENIK